MPEEMKLYVGTKIISACPMDEASFLHFHKDGPEPDPDAIVRPGYKVMYPDEYLSWSPKDVFENAYRQITEYEFILIKEWR